MSKKVTVIDVRTPMEFEQDGRVEGSINIPIDTFAQRVKEILAIDEPIILCCASGGRSFSAYQYLVRQGCKNVQDGGPWFAVESSLNN